MRVLLDEHLPVDLAAELRGHDVDTVTGRLRPLAPAILEAIAATTPGHVQRVGSLSGATEAGVGYFPSDRSTL